MSCYLCTLRLCGEAGSEVRYTYDTTKLLRFDRHRLRDALVDFPEKMPRFVREKLSEVVGLHLSLGAFEAAPPIEAHQKW